MCIKYYLTHKGRFLILLSARERGKLCDENTQLGGFHLVKATRKSTWRKKWLIGGLNTRRALALYKVETKAFRKWGQEQLHCGSLNRAHPGVKEGQCGWGGSGRWTTGLANGLWFYPEHTGRPGGQLHQFFLFWKPLWLQRASLEAQMVKILPAVQEIQVWSLGGEDPPEKGMATHSSILAWGIPWTEEPSRPQPMGSQRVGHDWATNIVTWLHRTTGLDWF